MSMDKKARKLYFDITLTGSTNASVDIITGAPLFGADPDRFGCFLAELPALDGSSPPERKRQQEVTAIFVPRTHSGALHGTQASYVEVTFVIFNGSAFVPAPFYTSPGTTTVAAKAGASGVFASEIGLHVRRPLATGSATLSGTLYVSRQHSIEI